MNYGQHTLFLDDDAERRRKFVSMFPASTCVTNVKDCIRLLQEGQFVTLFLDHDLGGETLVDSDREDCGMEVVRWLQTNRPDELREVIIHSLNPVGATNMIRGLDGLGLEVYHVPFGMGKFWGAQR